MLNECNTRRTEHIELTNAKPGAEYLKEVQSWCEACCKTLRLKRDVPFQVDGVSCIIRRQEEELLSFLFGAHRH